MSALVILFNKCASVQAFELFFGASKGLPSHAPPPMHARWVLSSWGFHFPITLTCWHMFFCSVLSFLLVRFSRRLEVSLAWLITPTAPRAWPPLRIAYMRVFCAPASGTPAQLSSAPPCGVPCRFAPESSRALTSHGSNTCRASFPSAPSSRGRCGSETPPTPTSASRLYRC